MSIGGARVALVSEVLDHLLEEFGTETSQRSVLFQAALQVCAEESRRVKQGQPPASLEVLVERARAALGSPQGKAQLEASRGSKPPVQFETPIDARPPAVPVPPVSMPRFGAEPPPSMPIPPTPPEMAEPPEMVMPPELPPLHRKLESGPDLFAGVSGYAGRHGQAEPRRRLLPFFLVILTLAAVGGGTYVGLQYFGPALGLGGGPLPTPQASPPSRASGQAPRPAPTASTAPTPPPVAAPTAVPTANSPTGSAPAVATVAAPTALPATETRKPVPVAAGGWHNAETMVSPDWTGHAPTYVVHFSSYRERAKAEREALVIGKRYGRPAYAAQVTIPGRGLWYRVILGDFDTASAAHDFRAELLAAKTEGVGAVYWVVAP